MSSMLAMHIESCYFLAFSTLVGLLFRSSLFVPSNKNQVYPKLYPLIDCSLEFLRNRVRIIQWTSEIFDKLSSSTYTLEFLLGRHVVCTKDPSNVKHILKTRFTNYHKERKVIEAFSNLFGKALFLSDGTEWKSQRQFLQHDFDPKEFHTYTSVVEEELLSRLVPFLCNAEKTASTIDLQDILCRFTFDSVCQIGFEFDPKYLFPSLPLTSFADTYKTATKLSILSNTVRETREMDGRLSDMVYMHASIHESLRLFPHFPADSKEAVEDDVWSDGTKVKKGTTIFYHIFSMVRSPKLWGSDWAEFRPERWLERRSGSTDEWYFIARDPFTYPVFHAGPRICLGKEIAVVIVKMVAATILKHFQVILSQDKLSQNSDAFITSRMKHGFPARERKGCDLDQVKCIKGEDGTVLVEDGHIKNRWQSYFYRLLNDEGDRAIGLGELEHSEEC
ncbi:hypothetical protein BC332_16705 [Capsicum chinense]|nr:hypothetical protein BC332_16705 [Capsicum chinense]